MIRRTLADTSAIVGYLSVRDQWHRRAYSHFETLPKPFYTCEAVITESCFRVSATPGGVNKVLGMLASGIVLIGFSLDAEIERVMRLIKKYEDVPMSLADACLVRMSELEPDSAVFTFDGDFGIYRRNGRRRIETIPAGDFIQ